MLFKQFLNDDLGCACYLVGDEHAGLAVVVDPPYHVEPVLAEAERRDVRLVGVVETHTHADHVSGHGRLALEHGIPIRVHAAAEAVFPHEPLEDGTDVEAGDVVLRTIHTPGHRPEHCSSSPATRSSSATPAGRIWRSRREREPRASSTACAGSSSSGTASRSSPATSRGRSAVPR